MRVPALCFLVLFQACSPLLAQSPSSAESDVSASAKTNRLALFDSLCKALHDNYPMLEYAGWKEEWEKDFHRQIEAAASNESAFELMDELLCRLNDYHTRLSWPGRPRTAPPPCRIEPVLMTPLNPTNYGIWSELRPPPELPQLDGVAIAVVEAENETLRVGDEIIAVGDLAVGKALAAAWKHSIGCSVAGKLRSAAWRMLSGPPGSELALTVRRDGKAEPVKVMRSGTSSEQTLSMREVEGIPVIRIARWNGRDLGSRFDAMLSELRTRSGLIIDVRGNGGGEDELASQVTGRFISKPVISSISFHRKVPALTFERTVDYTQPRGPWRYEGRVAVLADEGSMSACEHFVSGMVEAGALVCGTPTSGACGWIRNVQLPEGLRLNVSQTFPLHTAGIPSPLLGIAPHLWAPRTLADLRAGKDTALTAALNWIRTKDPLPNRLQPMATFSK